MFEERLRSLIEALELLQREYELPVVCSTHPRTRAVMGALPSRCERHTIRFSSTHRAALRLYRAWSAMPSAAEHMRHGAVRVLHLQGPANVTIRDVTSAPRQLNAAANMLSGADPATLLRCVAPYSIRKLTGPCA